MQIKMTWSNYQVSLYLSDGIEENEFVTPEIESTPVENLCSRPEDEADSLVAQGTIIVCPSPMRHPFRTPN